MGVHWITLADGRRAFIDQLHQYRTYGGLVLGEPSVELNDQRIQQAVDRARKWVFRPIGPYLVKPDRIEPDEQGGFQVEYLPRTVCIAQLEDPDAPTFGSGKEFSFLTVVWFQEDFAFPIGEQALSGIRAIPWDEHAEDGLW